LHIGNTGGGKDDEDDKDDENDENDDTRGRGEPEPTAIKTRRCVYSATAFPVGRHDRDIAGLRSPSP
jgi:hypothetical protein